MLCINHEMWQIISKLTLLPGQRAEVEEIEPFSGRYQLNIYENDLLVEAIICYL